MVWDSGFEGFVGWFARIRTRRRMMMLMLMLMMMARGKDGGGGKGLRSRKDRGRRESRGWRKAEEDGRTAEYAHVLWVKREKQHRAPGEVCGKVIWRPSRNVGMRRGTLGCFFASRAFL
jgi:hypothetical protein